MKHLWFCLTLDSRLVVEQQGCIDLVEVDCMDHIQCLTAGTQQKGICVIVILHITKHTHKLFSDPLSVHLFP